MIRMRLCILVPVSFAEPITLSVCTEAGIDELRAEGAGVLDLGVADDRLGDGVAPVRHLMPFWLTEPELLLDLRDRLENAEAAPAPAAQATPNPSLVWRRDRP